MQFKFDANQDFQLQAIEAVAGLLAGQPRVEVDLRFSAGRSTFAAVANRLDLDEAELLQNLQTVQRQNNITPDAELKCIEGQIETDAGEQEVRFYNFSVEMETGTGKTYVYLRTALELHRRYGLRKFIIVVPSVAIREGVLKTIEMTRAHLAELYDNVPYRHYAYDSEKLSQVRQFVLSDSVEFMVMTIAAFNKASNVIRQTTDRLQGATPVHLVQAARPVLILDEPQNMESEKSIAALAVLNPLFALRYSATHRNPYNVVYRLTPFEAYREGLVKRIEVAGVVEEGETGQPYLRLEDISAEKRTFTARLAARALMKDGTVREQVYTLRPGASLAQRTGRKEYAGYEVDEIDLRKRHVRFANNVELAVGQELGTTREAVFEAQIRYTVEQHMRRQEELRQAGVNVKVLSLFFIDRVDNYARADGVIRRLFDQAFEELKREHPAWKKRKAAEVQAAYFAQRRTRGGAVILEDSRTGEAESDRQVYELIMKDKERLLSFEEPVSFIFSHSALREGWDNPNVFLICTLNQTASEVKKRQEVGRGMRLPVDQAGERVRDPDLNVLTVVANESYESFVTQLQSEIAFEYREEIEARYGKPLAELSEAERREIEREYGKGILPPPPPNARKRAAAKLRQDYIVQPEFQELWNRIRQRTRYAVHIDSARLVRDVVAQLAQEEVRPPRVTITKAQLEVKDGAGIFEALQMSAAKSVLSLAGRYPLPNLVEIISDRLEHTSPPVRLTRRTLLEIIRQAPEPQVLVDSPHEFATVAVRIIKDRLADQLVDGIQYEKIDDWYEMSQWEQVIEGWEDRLVPAQRCLYDKVPYDSDVERKFVQELDRRKFVRLYVKLPPWFTVPTPIGDYNPDWAIVLEDRDAHGDATGRPLLYMVCETKSTRDRDELRPDERRKIACGERCLKELGVAYQVVTSAKEVG